MIPVVELLRIEENSEYGTFGIMRIQKRAFCCTLEPPDLENRPFKSSIPAQQYMVRKKVSPKYGLCFEIQDVPDRDDVLIHPGNIVEHTEACVIIGQYFGNLEEKRAVLNSGATYRKFMARMRAYDTLHLTITEHF